MAALKMLADPPGAPAGFTTEFVQMMHDKRPVIVSVPPIIAFCLGETMRWACDCPSLSPEMRAQGVLLQRRLHDPIAHMAPSPVVPGEPQPEECPPALIQAMDAMTAAPPVQIGFRFHDLYNLIALVQLSTRATNYTEMMARHVGGAARELQRSFARPYPAIFGCLEMGWDPTLDQPQPTEGT